MADFTLATAAARTSTSASSDSRVQAGLPSSSLTPRAAAPEQLGMVPLSDTLVESMPMQLGMPPETNPTTSQMELCIKASPTAAEMEGWDKILHAALWAGFSENRTPVLHSLMEHLDLDVDTPLRIFGRTTEARFAVDLDEWIFNGRKAKSTHITLAEGLLHAARVFVGAEKSWHEQIRDDKSQQWVD